MKKSFLLSYVFLFASLLVFSAVSAHFYQNQILTPEDVIAATNQVRADHGLSPLRESPTLDLASDDKAFDMAVQKYFAHNNPQGLKPWDWIKKNDYHFTTAGENLAINFTDTDRLLNAWLKSPEHRENLLNPGYQDVGVSIRQFNYEGKNYTVVVQMLASPQTVGMK